MNNLLEIPLHPVRATDGWGVDDSGRDIFPKTTIINRSKYEVQLLSPVRLSSLGLEQIELSGNLTETVLANSSGAQVTLGGINAAHVAQASCGLSDRFQGFKLLSALSRVAELGVAEDTPITLGETYRADAKTKLFATIASASKMLDFGIIPTAEGLAVRPSNSKVLSARSDVSWGDCLPLSRSQWLTCLSFPEGLLLIDSKQRYVGMVKEGDTVLIGGFRHLNNDAKHLFDVAKDIAKQRLN